MNFSLTIEVIAAMIILLLALYSLDKKSARSIKNRLYRCCLYISLAAIVVDALSVWGIQNMAGIPLWLNIFISSLNYLLVNFNSVVIAMYLSGQIFEHFPRHHSKKRIFSMIAALYGIVIAAVLYNLFSGCLFRFENGQYVRGPLNLLGYVVLVSEVVLVGSCYMKYNKIASISMRKAMRTMPYVVCGVVLLQILYRDVMMNGMIAALVDLILFLSFQSSRNSADYLTNLGNRGAFVEELAVWTKRKRRFHVVMLSLNKFGRVNREFGQKNGDEFLYAVARYLDDFSPDTKAYRLGSLEFAMLCPDEECRRVGHCIQVIRERFTRPWEIGDMKYLLSVSFSDILWEGQQWDGTQIIERLEYAMTQAKTLDGNGWVHFDDKVNEMMEHQKYMIEQMREAISNESFVVYYQPIYCWQADLFCSAEALVRMLDKNGNLVPPNEFIPLGETTGLIKEISWIILEKVCSFMAAYPGLGIKGITLNMSMQQFMDDDMEVILERILQKYSISYRVLKIEITERIISENPKKAKKIMESLTQKGVCFYLDDFGTGYSNFAGVLSLPFETVKLDKSLTDKVLGTEKERQIVRSIVEMFIKAGYNIVAEGAETKEVVDELKRLGVHRIQGYYYSRPLPETEFLEFMKKDKIRE